VRADKITALLTNTYLCCFVVVVVVVVVARYAAANYTCEEDACVLLDAPNTMPWAWVGTAIVQKT